MFFKTKQEKKSFSSFKEIARHVKDYLDTFENLDFRGAIHKRPLEVAVNDNIRFIRLSLQTDASFHLDTIEIIDSEDKNIAKGNKTSISSSYQDDERYSGFGVLEQRRNAGCGFHTKKEKSPWLLIDLSVPKNIKKLVIYNRDDMYFTRALSLLVQVGNDLSSWKTVHDNLAPIRNYIKDGMSEEEVALAYVGVFDETRARKVIERFTQNGDYDKAIDFHESVNEIIKSKGLALGPHGYSKTFELTSSESNQQSYDELSKLLTWLNEEFGVAAFASSGTLLGLFRDGKFIGHDDDIDICYVSNKTKPEEILAERNKLVEFLKGKGCKLNPSVAAHYWCTMPSGVNIDIFTGFFEEGFCSMNPLARKGVKVEDVIPIQKQTIQNSEQYLPRDPEQLMILNYGPNWRVPDPLWKFDWSNVKEEYGFLFF